jgi:hypothetical protein
MTKMIFYPLGNADTTLVHLADDRLILMDFCNYPQDGEKDRRICLDEELHHYLKTQKRDYFDLVAFSHADDDHLHGAEDFFYFRHAKCYQGEDRIHINNLVVPACFILEAGLDDSARAIRAEARFRFKEGSGITVLGDPEPLSDWLVDEGINPATRSSLIAKAGTCMPGYDRNHGQVEIFIHSPFSYKMEGEDVLRNENSIVLHLTFYEGPREVKCMLGGDAEYKTWATIYNVTTWNHNEGRLAWDLFRIAHHCSYSALSEEKGKNITVPCEDVADLFDCGRTRGLLISSSDLIPIVDSDQPPHRQAAAFYQSVARKLGSDLNFMVTMDWPPRSPKPRPMVVNITSLGPSVEKNPSALGGTGTVLSRPTPRMG